MKKIEEEIELLDELNYLRVKKISNELYEVIYKKSDDFEQNIKVFFTLNFNNEKQKDKLCLGKIFTSFNFEEISNFINKFVSEFEWRESVYFKHFFKRLDRDLNSKFEEINKNLELIGSGFQMICNNQNFYDITLMINFIALLIKSLNGNYGYSGENDPPKFGDYEAQRHWMELTYNLNVSNWYTNSPDNNPKDYWPLDYPPLSGYYSYVWGYISNIFIPDSIRLKSSWGYETKNHKFLMRISVLISDLIFFHIPVFLLLKKLILNKQHMGDSNKKIIRFFILLFIILCTPILSIIDHGHFQYNCVMHGFYILSVYCLYDKKFILSIILFSLCINFKQMGLYYALPFPFYVVKVLLDEIKIKKSKIISFFYFSLNLVKYAFYTILTMALIWGPWIKENKLLDVINRIFPLWRGIFEDKVATFWCTLNIVYKIAKIDQKMLFKCSMLLTIFPSLFACFCILKHSKSSKKITNLAFFIVSMSFFFFSFHVHEKTILVPYLAYLLNYYTMKKILCSFTMVSLFSLYPLLKREGQHIPYLIFLIIFSIIFKFLSSKNLNLSNTIFDEKFKDKNKNLKELKNSENNTCGKIYSVFSNLISFIDIINAMFIISYHFAEIYIPAPKNYPYLYPMINAAYSFLNFMIYYILAQIKLFSLIGESKKAGLVIE